MSGTPLTTVNISASRSLDGSQPSPRSHKSIASPHPVVVHDGCDLSFVEAAEAAETRSATAVRPFPPRSEVSHAYPDPFSLFVLSRTEGEQLFEQ